MMTTLLMTVFGSSPAWAEEVTFTIGNKTTSATDETSGISYQFSSQNISSQNDYIRIKKEGTLTISASSAQITGITISYVSGKGTKSTNNLVVTSGGGTLTLATDGITASTWSGTSSNVVITDDVTNGRDIDINGLTVTYTKTSGSYKAISIEDLRIKHNISNPSRTVAGISMTTNGWMTYNNNNYTFLHSATGSGTTSTFSFNLDNANIDAGTKLTQIVLIAAPSSTFSDVIIDDNDNIDYLNTYTTTGNDQIVWTNESGATSATIKLKTVTNDARPSISQIWIFTNKQLTYSPADVTLTYSPTCSSATVGSNYEFTDITTNPADFRFDSQMTSDGGTGTTFNGYGLSTGKFTGAAGSSNGDVVIQAYFNGNDFFNSASANHHLVVVGENKNSWDFTTTEAIDLSNISEGSDWTENNTVYDNNEITTSSSLTANNIPLLLTDGLSFKGYVSVVPNNYLRLRNSGTTLTIPNVAANKYVKITFSSTNTNDVRGFYVTSGGTGSYTTIVQKTVYIPVQNAGDFTISSTEGFNIYNIAIVDEIPHESMFTMTTPASTTGVSTSTGIVLTADRAVEVVGEGNTVDLTVNGTTVPFTFNPANNTLTCTNEELVYAGITLANETSYTIALPVDVIHVDGGAMNSAQNFAFVTAAQETGLTPEYNRTWTFDEFETSAINSTIIENNMELVGTSSKDMSINGSTKTYNDVTYTSRLQFKGAGDSEGRYIHFKVVAGSTVSVWGVSSNSSEYRTINISTGATFSSTPVASNSIGSTMGVLEYTSTEAADIYIYANGGFNIYGVKVESNLPGLTRFSPKGNQYTTLNKVGRTQWPEYYVLYAPTEANIQAEKLTITSSDPTVLDVSEVSYDLTSGQIGIKNMKMGEGGTATITLQFNGNSSYTPTSTDFTLTVDAAGQFRVQVADQQIQQGQRTVVTPVITDKNGHQLGIRDNGNGNYSTFILSEDDDTPDYTQYFDFTYSVGEGTGTNYNYINIDGSGNVTTKTGENYAEVGDTRVVNVTGTIKSGYESLFTNGSISGSGTMTIVAAAVQLEVDFFFDAACTDSHKIRNYVDNRVEGSTGIFGDDGTFPDGFPNGRMIYVKPTNAGDEIWFSYAKNATAANLTSEHKIDKKKNIFQYRRGIPIYIDETVNEGDYIFVNAVAMYKNESGNWQLRGGVAKMKFLIVDHARPDHPTYDPVSPDPDASLNKDNRKIMNTSQNVVAYGEGASKTATGNGNLVYGKFSTSSVYSTFQLINEETVSSGINSVPVVSTEVNKRRFTAVQIRKEAEGEEYISTQTYTEYYYLYDTRLAINPSGNQYINVNTSTTAPTSTVKWYNKVTPGWQDVETKNVTYSIVERNGASDASINESTGNVTAGSNTGWVRVKASYAGSYPDGENHGGNDKDGEPQYNSQLAPSEAYFYVYISDPSQEEPEITPPSRKFTSTQTYKIKAPTNWDVHYTIDGTEPSATNGTYLKHGTTVEAVATGTTTVKAIAYNPDATTNTSRVVSETYTKVDPLPDPIFNPDGVPTPWYYNTNSLTVQIACAYAGSVIYYTVDGSTPEIDADGTFKYSGLEKVIISGNKAIKAIAYDPENDIYSNVVTSNYIYSTEMAKPYFQISNDGGTTWLGLNDSGALVNDGTYWNNGQSQAITPTTQIRIIDPNPVKGTIFYTLNGDVPSADDPNVMIFHNNPFTLAKTTTGKAITILDEASSQVASAEFVIDLGTYSLWEAVEETTPGGKLMVSDGLVISTNKDLKVSNSAGGKVNLNSIDKGNGGNATYMFARADITATFGGFDLKDWTYMTLADDAIGVPIDNVGSYTIKNNVTNNARDELDNAYYHVYTYKKDATQDKGESNAITTHEKTFKLPTMGAYVQFEPEKDGDLTIWALQQGALLYEEDQWFVPNVLRLRPVYFLDEQGNSYEVKKVNGVPQMWSSAHLSTKWQQIQATASANSWKNSHYDTNTKKMAETDEYAQWIRKSDGEISQTQPSDYSAEKYKRIVNKGPNATETKAIYDMYNKYLTDNSIGIGDPLTPFAIHTGTKISLNDGSFIEDCDDKTGYVLPTGGYTKYTFEVKAGKTYYFVAQATKIGIRGFQFVPTESSADRTDVEIDVAKTAFKIGSEEKSPADAVAAVGEKPVNVTLMRSFTANPNQWAALVLPFSVSTTQVEKVFGAETTIAHFNNVTKEGIDYTLHMRKHLHQMIVAGTPIIIRPTQTVTDPVFYGVHLEASEVETITDPVFSMVGTLTKQDEALHQYDYFVSTEGKFRRWTGNPYAMKGTQAWLRPAITGANAPKLSITLFDDDADETTGIINIDFEDMNGNSIQYAKGVYNLKGEKVSDGSLNGLPKGVYIVNGKKTVVE